jgi:hypothetical protein
MDTSLDRILMLAIPAALALGLTGCGNAEGTGLDVEQTVSALGAGHRQPELEVFSFTTQVSTSGAYADGDVRLESITAAGETWRRRDLQTVRSATILVDDGVDVARGGHNLAAGQGINSVPDSWETEGPATITPTGDDLAGSLGNFNLTSIVVTRENVGTASVEVEFHKPSKAFFFWERGSTASPTTANSDLLVEALDPRGRVVASHKLLRTEYTPTGIAITTWNGSFASPSTPEGTPPQLGAAGLSIDAPIKRLRLTSVQQDVGGVRDDGPDYKVIAADPEAWPHGHDDHGGHGR